MERLPLVYTFGNHMHWVDMEWLWGYHVLPGSVRDMLRLIDQAGVKGNVNFEGVGYEKLAAEDPEALSDLRQAVADGRVEPVGASYGQPYGLFQGGESNIRQRIYGARAVRRLLGVWPTTFWEEEFDFFPQLPQMLSQCGFRNASLYFQWTWHTPEVPHEPHSTIWWEGIDGSRLKTAPRNTLNLHQWPEDFQHLLDRLVTEGPQSVLADGADEVDAAISTPPLVLQWLELMPSPDWMCRSELMLPKLQELSADPRFEVVSKTLGGYLDDVSGEGLPVRRYTLNDVWHGMTLGKNGDWLRIMSAQAERELLHAEALASSLSLFGRPYAQWDVYPTWELEEAWRNLLMAQHHDNDECEGLCGHIGAPGYDVAYKMAHDVAKRAERLVPDPFSVNEGDKTRIVFNTLGFPVEAAWIAAGCTMDVVPPYGWAPIRRSGDPVSSEEPLSKWIGSTEQRYVPQVSASTNGIRERFVLDRDPDPFDLVLTWSRGTGLSALERSCPIGYEVSISTVETDFKGIDPGLKGACLLDLPFTFEVDRIVTSSAYAAHDVDLSRSVRRLRKYPSGDWMTSEQWFEEVGPAWTSLDFCDFVDAEGNGMLVCTLGTTQWLMSEEGIPQIVLM